jgi:hypothetical protein
LDYQPESIPYGRKDTRSSKQLLCGGHEYLGIPYALSQANAQYKEKWRQEAWILLHALKKLKWMENQLKEAFE